MKRRGPWCVLIVTIVLALLATGDRVTAQPPPGIKVFTILTLDLSGAAPGLDGKILRVWGSTMQPGYKADVHCHPGHELTFLVKGVKFFYHGEYKTDATGNFVGTPREFQAWKDPQYLAPRNLHSGQNAGTEPVTVLMLSISDKDTPVIIPTPRPGGPPLTAAEKAQQIATGCAPVPKTP
jgi:hypothetical protein